MFLAVVVLEVLRMALVVLGATEDDPGVVIELVLEVMVVEDDSSVDDDDDVVVVIELSEVEELLLLLELCDLDIVVAFAFVAVPLTGVSV